MSEPVIVVKGATLTQAERAIPLCPWPAVKRAQSLQWLVTLLFPLVPLGYLTASLDAPLSAVAIALAAYVLGVLALMQVANSTLRAYAREIADSPTGADADDWRLDAQTIQFASPLLTSTFSWRALVDVDETHGVFYFLMSPTQIFGLSRRHLSEADAEALRTLIEAARQRGDLKGVPGR